MRWRDTPRRCAPPSSGIGSDVAEFCSDGCVERHVAHRLLTGHHDFNVEVLDAEYGFVEHVTQRRMWTPLFLRGAGRWCSQSHAARVGGTAERPSGNGLTPRIW